MKFNDMSDMSFVLCRTNPSHRASKAFFLFPKNPVKHGRFADQEISVVSRLLVGLPSAQKWHRLGQWPQGFHDSGLRNWISVYRLENTNLIPAVHNHFKTSMLPLERSCLAQTAINQH